MRTALHGVLKDPGFEVTTSARESQRAASSMLEALGDGEDLTARTAVQGVVSTLATCVRGKRVDMWGVFHRTRTSTEFIAAWEQLMTITIEKIASPIFYQYITDALFKELVKRRYPLPARPDEERSPLPALDYQEQNAVRYAAGYVVKNLRQRLERGSHPLKEDLVLCLEDMCVDDGEESSSAEWTKNINRGGLKMVNGTTFRFFQALENRLRESLRVTSAQSISEGIKSTLMEAIASDEDVLFFWTILSAEWEEEEEQALLSLVIELWITICGFSFARSFLEMYKQANKKSVQKSKGLRKKLST